MDSRLVRLSIVLTVLGMIVAAYMTVYKLTDNQSMCLGNGGCSIVNTSVYSEVYGVPVAFVGLLGYAAILTVLIVGRGRSLLARNAVLIAFGLCLAGFIFTAYLIYVEIALIHALCPFCLASQAIMTALFALSVARMLREPTG